MAQAGSQNTTPSPVMPSAVAAAAGVDPDEQAQRQKAIDTFLARTEFSKLARVLRARLSYASYKATHNVAHVPLTSLEHQLASRPQPPEQPRKLNHTTTMPPPPAQDSRLLRSAGMSLYQAVLDPGPNVLNARRSRPPPQPNGRERLAVPGRTVRTARRRHAHTLSTEREDINAATTLTAIMRGGTTPTSLSRTSSASSAVTRPEPTSRTPQPDDEAAELMLFLATSPSPARPTARPRQQPSGLGPSRVLFPQDLPTDGQPRMLFPEQLPTPEASQSTPPPPSPQRFNLGDYINVSPSPAAVPHRTPVPIQGRRLFDQDNDRYLGVSH